MSKTYGGPGEGARLLEALGIDTKYMLKAVITISVDSLVTIECTRHAQWNDDAKAYDTIKERYKVERIQDGEV